MPDVSTERVKEALVRHGLPLGAAVESDEVGQSEPPTGLRLAEGTSRRRGGGTMATDGCNPRRPVSVLHFHGTRDEYVPFAGGVGSKSVTGANHRSVEHSIRARVRANGCREEPAVEVLPDRTKDGTRVTVKTHGGGTGGAEVVLVVVEGGGHTCPGRQPGTKVLGRATMNVSANDLIWEFFQRHPMA